MFHQAGHTPPKAGKLAVEMPGTLVKFALSKEMQILLLLSG
jgi:hypothetical protein